MMPLERLPKLQKTAETSKTETQFESRKALLGRLIEYIEKCADEVEFYASLLTDFPVWCTAFLNGDGEVPLFLALWQQEYSDALERFKYVWAMCSRQVGKSTLLSAKILFAACEERRRIIVYAPTRGQDFVFRDIRRFLRESEFIREKYIDSGGIDTAERILLSNGSEIINRTIGLQTKGELTLGEKANIVVIDEIELIEKEVFVGIIQPILSSAYSEKRLWMLGTPKLDANPRLDEDWRYWQTCESIGCDYIFEEEDTFCKTCGESRGRITIAVDWLRGVEEGCLDEDTVKKHIATMTQDEIDMWYGAKFPELGDRFYPRTVLYECGTSGPDFAWITKGLPNRNYIMAIDWGKHKDRTQILVAELLEGDEKMKYVYWKEIDPRKGVVSMDTQVRVVKDIFVDFGCSWVIADATTMQDVIIENLVSGDDAIPPGLMYKDAHDHLGYRATGESNYAMHRNHRTQILNKNILVPKIHPFFQQWVNEHNQLQAKPVQSGRYVKLEEPRNAFKDLAVTSAMLSLRIEKKVTPPWFGVHSWG